MLHTHSLSVCLIFLETKARCKCSIFFCLRFPLLGKVLQAQSSLRASTGKHGHTNRNMFRILNPSGQISLIWAENKILTNKKAHNVDTHVWIRSIQSRNNKTHRHSHSHKGTVGKCHRVKLSRQSWRSVHPSVSLSVLCGLSMAKYLNRFFAHLYARKEDRQRRPRLTST